MRKIFILLLPLCMCRCSTMGKSTGLGAGIGAGVGFTGSRIADYNGQGTIVLTASSALIGGLIGAFLHRDPIGAPPPPGMSIDPPPLKGADTDVIWIPDTIQDGKYIEGHRVWQIRSPSHWQLKAEEKKKEAGKSGPK